MSLKKSPYRRRVAIAQLFLLLAIALHPEAFAFKQKYHEQETESRLQGAGFDVDSADEVGDSNYYTDIAELLSDAAHGDNNQLAASSARLRQKRTQIGDALNACERRRALDTFGEALHTVQDLHSHTNSLDNGIALGDILNLSNGTAACSLPNFAPGGLVSGYFNAIGGTTRLQCLGKPANMCCHYDLNKDEPEAPNGQNGKHANALNRAGVETLNYLSLVEQDVRARFGEPKATQLLKMFKKKQRTTFFVIDDTGSMGNDIAGVKAAANAFLDQIIAGDEAPTLGLVTFKDSPSDRGVTCDLAALRAQINGLFASGGGDCPEAMNAGLLAALSHFPLIGTDMQLRGGRILLATDASAGDSGSGPAVAVQSALKGVSIDAILTGDCAAEEFTAAAAGPDEVAASSENEPVEGFAAAALEPATDAVDPLTSISARTYLRALTEITGGVLFNVSRLEVDDVVPTLLDLSKPDTAILLGRKVNLTAGVPFSLQIPIDDTLRDRVTFMVTASRSGILPTFTLKRPDGSTVGTSDPGVSFRSLSSVRSYTITAPATGRWEAQLSGAGSFVLRVFGSTPFRLNSVRLLNRTPGFQRPEIDYVPLDGQPVVGDDVFADLRFTDGPTALNASVVQPDGVFLAALSPVPLDGFRRFRTDLHVPATTFILETTGLTPGGAEFVRQVSVPATPQTVAVDATPEQSIVAPGSAATVQVSVRNAGTADTTFRLRTTSTLPWFVSGPGTITVAAGATASASFSVNVPAGALEGQQSSVTFFAESVADTRVRNSATVGVLAGSANQPPVCTSAAASPSLVWSPNHDMAAIEIAGVTDPDGDPVTLTVDGITQDEPVLGTGSGDTAPDGDGVGTATARVRAERSGTGDGRVYSIQFRASDGRGGSCSGSVRVSVPHDQNDSSAADSGQAYDSTSTP
ncbi:MAG TPA: hypothetical protein VGX68_14780 [Thermoanaerobaculia bacterium]|jgi:hypothetical protein|nr:hypothetical protein [Thermoanaerobaculia bacterium]